MVEALGGTETGRACTDNENVDVAADGLARFSLTSWGQLTKHKEHSKRTYQPLLRICCLRGLLRKKFWGEGQKTGKKEARRAVKGCKAGEALEKRSVFDKETSTRNRTGDKQWQIGHNC